MKITPILMAAALCISASAMANVFPVTTPMTGVCGLPGGSNQNFCGCFAQQVQAGCVKILGASNCNDITVIKGRIEAMYGSNPSSAAAAVCSSSFAPDPNKVPTSECVGDMTYFLANSSCV